MPDALPLCLVDFWCAGPQSEHQLAQQLRSKDTTELPTAVAVFRAIGLLRWQPAASRGTLQLALDDGRQARVLVRLTDDFAVTALGEPQLLGRSVQEDV